MLKIIKLLFLVAFTSASYMSFANDELDKSSEEALQKTKEVLLDASKRKEAMKDNNKAQEGDKHLESFTGSAQNKEAMYRMSADIMENIVKSTNGDAAAMQKMMEDAQKDPEAFYKAVLTDAQKAQVRGLANEIEKSKSPANSPQQ